jgi:hypothetical protein
MLSKCIYITKNTDLSYEGLGAMSKTMHIDQFPAIRPKDGIAASYHRKRCESLEIKANAESSYGYDTHAAKLYLRAADHAHKLKDTNRQITLLIRGVDSFETHADYMLDIADFYSGSCAEQELKCAEKSLYKAAINLNAVVDMGMPEFTKRLGRLVDKLQQVRDILFTNYS